MKTVYLGWDAREAEAFHVCQYSVHRHTPDAEVIALRQNDLRKSGLYRREERRDAMGTRIDVSDGKPFSTEFSFTRFLVPVIHGPGWALGCDSDILFTVNLEELFAHADPRYAVMVVKHNHVPKERDKMDGVPQTIYDRKNWSSLILWNCGHASNQKLTSEEVNTRPGWWLHGFHWLHDEEIGSLPPDWNHLVGVDKPIHAKAYHYTLGIPSLFPEMAGVEMPNEEKWLAEWARMNLRKQMRVAT